MGEAAEEANRAGPEMIWAVPQQEWYINLLTPNQNKPSTLNLLSLSMLMVLELFMITSFYLLEITPSGANGGASAEASGPATQKALPPWMLRQGITSTSAAPGGQPLGAPFMQAAAANDAGVGSSNDAIASEKDQKEIEVNFGHVCCGGLSACSMCAIFAIQTCKGGKRLRLWYSNSYSICAARAYHAEKRVMCRNCTAVT